MVLDFIKKKRVGKYVCLPKDKSWLFCFKKKCIIEHKDCDYYEHNLECDRNNDYWNRTHTDSSIQGYRIVGEPYSVLNECDYCLEQAKEYEKYVLSDDARKVINDDRY